MHEFKFRVWDKETKCFLIQDMHYLAINGTGIVYNYKEIDLGILGSDVDDFVAQQFTGIKDKNNQRIFEGDVVQYTEKMYEHGDACILIATVFYDEGAAAFALGRKNEIGEYELWNYFTDGTIHDFRILGNIFDNSELLQ